MSTPSIPRLSIEPYTGPALGFRFAVVFFAAGVVPNPIDVRFQRVSGLGATIDTMTIVEGGQNLFSHRVPTRVSYGNLILVRHADGWVSAYAHNSEIDVKRGDTVQRGQTIAKAGMTGSVSPGPPPQVARTARR